MHSIKDALKTAVTDKIRRDNIAVAPNDKPLDWYRRHIANTQKPCR